MASDIIISQATDEHLPVIHRLAHQIWPVTFRDILAEEQIRYMLEWMYSLSSLEKQVKQGHHFLLARQGEEYLGYVSYEIEGKQKIAKLHKIYLLPSVQGKGIGKQLLNVVINSARNEGQTTLQLNVNRFNKAVQFYEKSGFKIIRKEDNNIGNGFFMNDYVMELIL